MGVNEPPFQLAGYTFRLVVIGAGGLGDGDTCTWNWTLAHQFPFRWQPFLITCYKVMEAYFALAIDTQVMWICFGSSFTE